MAKKKLLSNKLILSKTLKGIALRLIFNNLKFSSSV